MQVTLKKGAALASLLLAEAKKVSITSTVVFSEFGSNEVEPALEEKRSAIMADVFRLERFYMAAYRIRDQLGQANASAGVGSILTKIAQIDAVLPTLKSLAERGLRDVNYGEEPSNDLAAIKRRVTVERRKATETDGIQPRMGGSPVTVQAIDTAMANGFETRVRDMQREKEALRDQLAQINYGTTITLEDDVVEILKDRGLV